MKPRGGAITKQLIIYDLLIMCVLSIVIPDRRRAQEWERDNLIRIAACAGNALWRIRKQARSTTESHSAFRIMVKSGYFVWGERTNGQG